MKPLPPKGKYVKGVSFSGHPCTRYECQHVWHNFNITKRKSRIFFVQLGDYIVYHLRCRRCGLVTDRDVKL